MYKGVSEAVQACKNKLDVFSFDPVEGLRNWTEILELGRISEEKNKPTLDIIKEGIQQDDLASLIYTSGTTGKAKAVMLTHRNLVSNFLSAASVFQLNPSDNYLSILPLCHVGGRLGNYQTQYSGASIYYAENMGTIARDLADIRADGFDAVPRVLEKFYEVIISKGNKQEGFKKKVFFWAVELGLKYNPHGENGWIYELKHKIADKMVFSKWRQALGGSVRIVGCGGASLQSRLERVFWAAGIKIINMYGLTETSPIITINRTEKGRVKLGSVGLPIDGVEVKIAEDGEILCKGPNVSPGYYKDPELTRLAYDEQGWFHTGDIGHIDEKGFLMVTDRKKEIFKLSNGKFIAPQVIENIFKETPLIDQIMVIGEHQKFASALISPNFVYIEDWKKLNNIACESRYELIELPQVQSMFASVVEAINKKLNPYERLSRYKLVSDEWTPAGGELSPTLKLKRQVIQKKYHDTINQIYSK
jgi:long-chain acyl-CoA synthetase